MSPRNEFQARDFEGSPGEEIHGMFVDEHEDLNQEIPFIEEESPELTEAIQQRLADLRMGSGLTTTAAHIAERRGMRHPD